jgi:predicted N-acyltransferase
VSATFFTTALMKDDMLSSASQSEFIENIRQNGDPYYMCSRVTMMGSLITEGEHLFVDNSHPAAEEAMELIFIKAEQIQKARNAQSLMLRDFDMGNNRIENLGQKFDFLQKELPVNYSISLQGWQGLDGYLAGIGKKSRKHVRDNIIPETNKYDVIYDKSLMDPAQWYKLYLNVQQRGRELNTFPLTQKFFEKMHGMSNWDVVELWDKETGEVACAVFSFVEGNQYNTLLIGQNYEYSAYRPGLLAAILRGNALGCDTILLGYSCDMEKLRLGAKGKVKCAYIQTSDTFAYEYISMVSATKK